MKKTLLISTLLLSFVFLSACGPAAALSSQAMDVLGSVGDAAEKQTNTQAAELNDSAQATPVAPSSEAVGLLAAYEGALEYVYETVNPSVVNIRVVQQVTAADMQMPQLPGMPDLPFNLPGLPNQPGQPDAPQFNQGLGSGFVWDEAGYIITNNHVVENADKIEITFHDGTTLPAELVGADPDSDLAVVKVDAPKGLLMPVEVADSRQVKVGELAIAIGNPYGLEGTMTVGIISAVGRTMPSNLGLGGQAAYSIPDIIQTDAPINPGNSGGVLVNDQGQLIGVTFAIESTSGANAGIGFVIPSSIVERVVPALIEKGSYEHPYLGISGMTLSPELAKAMDLDANQRGALVGEVVSGGPADEAGLRGSDRQVEIDGQEISVGGDVIVAIASEKVNGMDDLIAYLTNNTTAGDKLSLTILRDGKEMKVDVTLGTRPSRAQTEETTVTTPKQAKVWLGIAGTTLTPALAEAMDLPSEQTGVLVQQVQTGSPADQAGLHGSSESIQIDGQEVLIGGDVITALDGQSVETIEDLVATLQKSDPGQEVTLTILRNSDQMKLNVTLAEKP
jgi:S1-C subfamily serine protease